MGKKMDLQSELGSLIRPIVEQSDAFLLDVHLGGSYRRPHLKVTVDTEKGVTLQECQAISRQISDLLFRKDLLQKDYRLEVSSPGLKKPLERPFEFRRNIGRNLRVTYFKDDRIEEVVGELKKYDENEIELVAGRESVHIALKDIEKAVVKLKW